jgi:hypothetical protein
MDTDDIPVGRVLTRREAVALLALPGVSLLAGRASAAPACVVRPAQTEGPYFVEERLNRTDIRSDPASGEVRPGAARAGVQRLDAPWWRVRAAGRRRGGHLALRRGGDLLGCSRSRRQHGRLGQAGYPGRRRPPRLAPVLLTGRPDYFLSICSNTPSHGWGGGVFWKISQRSAIARDAPSPGQRVAASVNSASASRQPCAR